MQKDTMIEIVDVNYNYGQGKVLDQINIQIKQGDYIAIVGANGSGKSTLLKLILGLLKIQSGEIFLFGQPLTKFKNWDKIGFVSQKANSFNSGFPATVYEVVASGLTAKIGLFKRLSKEDKQLIKQSIKTVGMEQFEQRNIGELSGGQQQRVFIARAIVSHPTLLILDEPTVGVDVENSKQFYEMLTRLNRELDLTLLLVTHDLDAISKEVSHVIQLNKRIRFSGTSDEFQHFLQREKSEEERFE